MNSDPFAVLGVASTATEEELKGAYRALSKLYHPDNCETGSAKRFKEIKEAYDAALDTIKNPPTPRWEPLSGFSGFGQFFKH